MGRVAGLYKCQVCGAFREVDPEEVHHFSGASVITPDMLYVMEPTVANGWNCATPGGYMSANGQMIEGLSPRLEANTDWGCTKNWPQFLEELHVCPNGALGLTKLVGLQLDSEARGQMDYAPDSNLHIWRSTPLEELALVAEEG